MQLEELNHPSEGTEQPYPGEVRQALNDLFGAHQSDWHVIDVRPLKPGGPLVSRVRVCVGGSARSVVVKRLRPAESSRNEFVLNRWLPAAGLDGSGAALLNMAAERGGRWVWHVYEDLGEHALDARKPDRARVRAALALMARLHTNFANHALLPECRLHGGDLGSNFFSANVRDSIRCLNALSPPGVELTSEQASLRDRLLERMHALRDEVPWRVQAIAELGGPETLLHGDLWTENTFVLPTANGVRARFIDWDHAGVGSYSYDLSTFLLRFPAEHRHWILELYRAEATNAGWRLPTARNLNPLFETAECARYANMILWPAIAWAHGREAWGFEMLAEIERWFKRMQPVLPEEKVHSEPAEMLL